MRLSSIRTIRIVITSILALLVTSFSSLSSNASPYLNVQGQNLSTECVSLMSHHAQHMVQSESADLGQECPSDTHSEQECCGTSCIVNIGADIHHVSVAYTQPSKRLKQRSEVSLLLSFQTDSLFRPPRA